MNQRLHDLLYFYSLTESLSLYFIQLYLFNTVYVICSSYWSVQLLLTVITDCMRNESEQLLPALMLNSIYMYICSLAGARPVPV